MLLNSLLRPGQASTRKSPGPKCQQCQSTVNIGQCIQRFRIGQENTSKTQHLRMSLVWNMETRIFVSRSREDEVWCLERKLRNNTLD